MITTTKQPTATPIKLSVTGAELSERWAREAHVGDDEQVEIIIRPDRKAPAKRLIESARRMRAEGAKNDLAGEKRALPVSVFGNAFICMFSVLAVD